MYKYPNTDLHKYDYVMTHDDEAGYLRQMREDPFNTINKSNNYFIAYEVGKRLKDEKDILIQGLDYGTLQKFYFTEQYKT